MISIKKYHSFHNKSIMKIERYYQCFILGNLFEKDEETDQPIRFDSASRHESVLDYRIPIHQRHPSWKKDKQDKLIDSVMRNYPIGSMIVSKRIEDNTEFYTIEDAQTRLTILQSFYNNKIKWTDKNCLIDNHPNDYLFKDIKPCFRKQFENYTINFEIIRHATNNDVHEIFERLQEGEPLKDEDKYWNRRKTPRVSYAFQLIKEPYWNDSYMHTINEISDKNRKRLSNIMNLIGAIVDGNGYFSKSFDIHGKKVKEPISDLDKDRIKNFLQYYNSIIDEAYREAPRQKKEGFRHFYNIGKDLGMILFDWLNNPDIREEAKEMWIFIINTDRRSSNFMSGKKTLWNGLSSAEKQNTESKNIAARVKRVREFYNNIDEFKSIHNIEFILE